MEIAARGNTPSTSGMSNNIEGTIVAGKWNDFNPLKPLRPVAG